MNREIKFRAWNKPTKQMFYFPSIMECFYALKGIDLLGSLLGDSRNWEKEHNEFMLYTNLKDKNGKEAYTEDIFKDEVGNIGVIDWNYPLLARLQEIKFEVIGNIYENPELLKDNQE